MLVKCPPSLCTVTEDSVTLPTFAVYRHWGQCYVARLRCVPSLRTVLRCPPSLCTVTEDSAALPTLAVYRHWGQCCVAHPRRLPSLRTVLRCELAFIVTVKHGESDDSSHTENCQVATQRSFIFRFCQPSNHGPLHGTWS